jgi:hypothetical protein
MGGPNEVHLDQLVAELEPQLVTTQSVLMAQLAFEVNALFFLKGRFTKSAFFFFYFQKRLSNVDWNFTSFPAFLASLYFHVPISSQHGLKVRTTCP